MRILPVIFIFCFSLSNAQMEQHKWKERVLLILSKKDSDLVKKQWKEFSEIPSKTKERKLVLYKVQPSYFFNSKDNIQQNSASLYREYKRSNKGFEVVLIGLDGGIKLRQAKFLTAKKLFTIIDGMPMRKLELRKN